MSSLCCFDKKKSRILIFTPTQFQARLFQLLGHVRSPLGGAKWSFRCDKTSFPMFRLPEPHGVHGRETDSIGSCSSEWKRRSSSVLHWTRWQSCSWDNILSGLVHLLFVSRSLINEQVTQTKKNKKRTLESGLFCFTKIIGLSIQW